MAPIRWETFLTDEAGVVSYDRVTRLVANLLGLFGGGALILAMAGILHPSDYVALGTSALVLPVTAGKITDAIAARRVS
jgi:hypothetical protein